MKYSSRTYYGGFAAIYIQTCLTDLLKYAFLCFSYKSFFIFIYKYKFIVGIVYIYSWQLDLAE